MIVFLLFHHADDDDDDLQESELLGYANLL
jgi:hypothetical protein